MHIFFTCSFAKEVWSNIPLRNPVDVADGLEFTEALLLFKNSICLPPTGIVGPIVTWVMWALWNARNVLIFEQKQSSAVETATKALRLALEWNQAQATQPIKKSLTKKDINPATQGREESILTRTITCKTDAAWDRNRNVAGLAWNFTDQSSQQPIEGSMVQPYVASPLIAEGLAIVAALVSAKDLGVTNIKVFSDCSTLIGAIKGSTQRKELIGIISDIRSISSGFTAISFSYFSRNQNSLSDRLAKTALCCSVTSPLWAERLSLVFPF